MCGIVGIYKRNGDINTEAIIRMRDTLARRGPDDSGFYISPDKRFCLAHTRLSIIDLSSAGHQPMSNREGTVWISFNGEIYNYRQLQDELKAKGCEFRSNSDTEVIVHGYKEWGIDGLLPRLRGMFAFAIYDSRFLVSGFRVILARDRFGIKPLYYYQDKELLIFSSEIKPIVKSGLIPVQRNRDADTAFLVFGNVPEPLTTIKDVFSLPSGSYMSIDDTGKRLVKYYDLRDSFTTPKVKDTEDVYNTLRSILSEAIDIHLISDAPLGVFLSGGIDSAALVALASEKRDMPLTTLSLYFDEELYSELPYQRMIAEKYRTDHREVKVTERDFYAEIDNIFEAMDQPTVDGVNTYFVSRAAKQAGLKAVLSGTGGDEVFCGYGSFKRIGLLDAIHGLPGLLKTPFVITGSLNDRWRKLGYLQNNDPLSLYLTMRALFVPKDVARILGITENEVNNVLENLKLQTPNLEPIDWLSYMEIIFYLKNQLLKDTDFMSMYHSVETRVPYLDHALVEYVASANPRLKIDKNMPKPLLVKSLKGMLPDEIVFRKKQGFTFPFDLWIRKMGKGIFEDAISKNNIDKNHAEGLWSRFESGKLHWSRVWALVVIGRQE